MKFREEVAKLTDSAIKIIKLFLKVDGSTFNIKRLSDITGFQRETIAKNLGKLKEAGIVEKVENTEHSFIIKLFLKFDGSTFNIKRLSDITGFQRETIARNLVKFKEAGIVEKVENTEHFFSLTDEFKQEYTEWKHNKNYTASEEDRARFNELNEKYWLIRAIVEVLINKADMFNLCFISHDELTANLNTAEHTNKKYLKILEENQFIKITQRGRFKSYAIEDSLLKIWEEIKVW